MTREEIQILSDEKLQAIILLANDEIVARATKRKQETIAEIRELARSVEIRVTVSEKKRKSRNARALST